MRAICIAILTGMTLSACASSQPPEPVVVAAAPSRPALPAECNTKRDPQWDDWSKERGLRTSAVLRRNDGNQTKFETLVARRRICAAATNRLQR